MTISRKQAEILLHLLSYGEILQREGGYFKCTGDSVNYKSLNALFVRGMITDHIRHTAPSCGLLSSPVFYDSSVTKKGREAFLKFVDTLRYPDFSKQWLEKAVALEET